MGKGEEGTRGREGREADMRGYDARGGDRGEYEGWEGRREERGGRSAVENNV